MYHPPIPAAANGRGLIAISPIVWRDPSWLSDDKRRTEGTMIITGNTAYYPNTKFTNKYKDKDLVFVQGFDENEEDFEQLFEQLYSI